MQPKGQVEASREDLFKKDISRQSRSKQFNLGSRLFCNSTRLEGLVRGDRDRGICA